MSNRKKSKATALQNATGHAKTSQHITKITAKPSHPSEHPQDQAEPSSPDQPQPELVVTSTGKTEVQAVDRSDRELNTPKKLTRAEKKALRASRKSDEERPIKSYFILLRPFVRLGRYLRDSWHEIRQVRWPNRQATWKMTGAVLIYCIFFFLFLLLVDTFFTFIFDLLFK